MQVWRADWIFGAFGLLLLLAACQPGEGTEDATDSAIESGSSERDGNTAPVETGEIVVISGRGLEFAEVDVAQGTVEEPATPDGWFELPDEGSPDVLTTWLSEQEPLIAVTLDVDGDGSSDYLHTLNLETLDETVRFEAASLPLLSDLGLTGSASICEEGSTWTLCRSSWSAGSPGTILGATSSDDLGLLSRDLVVATILPAESPLTLWSLKPDQAPEGDSGDAMPTSPNIQTVAYARHPALDLSASALTSGDPQGVLVPTSVDPCAFTVGDYREIGEGLLADYLSSHELLRTVAAEITSRAKQQERWLEITIGAVTSRVPGVKPVVRATLVGLGVLNVETAELFEDEKLAESTTNLTELVAVELRGLESRLRPVPPGGAASQAIIGDMAGLQSALLSSWRAGVRALSDVVPPVDIFGDCSYMDGETWQLDLSSGTAGVFNETEAASATVNGPCYSWDECSFNLEVGGIDNDMQTAGSLEFVEPNVTWFGTGSCVGEEYRADDYYEWEVDTVAGSFIPVWGDGPDSPVTGVALSVSVQGRFDVRAGATKPQELECSVSGTISAEYQS